MPTWTLSYKSVACVAWCRRISPKQGARSLNRQSLRLPLRTLRRIHLHRSHHSSQHHPPSHPTADHHPVRIASHCTAAPPILPATPRLAWQPGYSLAEPFSPQYPDSQAAHLTHISVSCHRGIAHSRSPSQPDHYHQRLADNRKPAASANVSEYGGPSCCWCRCPYASPVTCNSNITTPTARAFSRSRPFACRQQ